MCPVRPVLLYLNVHVLKVFYEQIIAWMNEWMNINQWLTLTLCCTISTCRLYTVESVWWQFSVFVLVWSRQFENAGHEDNKVSHVSAVFYFIDFTQHLWVLRDSFYFCWLTANSNSVLVTLVLSSFCMSDNMFCCICFLDHKLSTKVTRNTYDHLEDNASPAGRLFIFGNFSCFWVGNPQISPRNVKFGAADVIVGPLCCAKCHVNTWIVSPSGAKTVVFIHILRGRISPNINTATPN